MLKVQRLLASARERLVTVRTDALLLDAARLLVGPQRNLVVVCDDGGRMAGVITKTDIVNRIGYCTGCSCTMAASEVMTTKVAFCAPDDTLQAVWAITQQRNLKNVPVADRNSVPLGVLNAREVVRTLLEETQYEESLLRDYVMGVGYR